MKSRAPASASILWRTVESSVAIVKIVGEVVGCVGCRLRGRKLGDGWVGRLRVEGRNSIRCAMEDGIIKEINHNERFR